MVASQSTILPAGAVLSHEEALRLADLATRAPGNQVIVLDLSRCKQASTSAFARLVLLRRELLNRGRDLRLAGLRDQPARLFEVHRLNGALPTLPDPAFPAVRPRREPRATHPLAASA